MYAKTLTGAIIKASKANATIKMVGLVNRRMFTQLV